MTKVIPLEIEFQYGNSFNRIYPVLLQHQEELILIDCGYSKFLPLFQKAAENKGLNLGKLTKIIITHHDFDHMGALEEFKKAYPHIQVLSSQEQEKYISGREKSLRLQQAEALYDSFPEEQKPEARNFQKVVGSVKPVDVDIVLKDGEKFPWCGGTEIVLTPGHMPGHLSVYVEGERTFISGDALVMEGDKLCMANPQYTLDMEEAKLSVEKLLKYDIQKIICYHGGVFTGDVKQAFRDML